MRNMKFFYNTHSSVDIFTQNIENVANPNAMFRTEGSMETLQDLRIRSENEQSYSTLSYFDDGFLVQD